MQLRVLSLNVWGVRYVAKFIDQRLQALAEHLSDPENNYDIVGLQEVSGSITVRSLDAPFRLGLEQKGFSLPSRKSQTCLSAQFLFSQRFNRIGLLYVLQTSDRRRLRTSLHSERWGKFFSKTKEEIFIQVFRTNFSMAIGSAANWSVCVEFAFEIRSSTFTTRICMPIIITWFRKTFISAIAFVKLSNWFNSSKVPRRPTRTRRRFCSAIWTCARRIWGSKWFEIFFIWTTVFLSGWKK